MSEGEEPALQGLATSLIDHRYHARLFTSVAVVEILAKLVGGPTMGKLFSIGHAKSSGICFSVAAVSGLRNPGVPNKYLHATADYPLLSYAHCMCTKDQALKMGVGGRRDDLFWIYMLHILGNLCVLELDPVHMLLG